MSTELFSVEQVAQRLGLHVRTVRNYVREGRLKAVRIGKQYRIAREDLEALTGQSLANPVADAGRRHVEVSSIVDIEAIAPDEAARLSERLANAANARSGAGLTPRLDASYDEARAKLRVILTGDLDTNAYLLQLIALRLAP